MSNAQVVDCMHVGCGHVWHSAVVGITSTCPYTPDMVTGMTCSVHIGVAHLWALRFVFFCHVCVLNNACDYIHGTKGAFVVEDVESVAVKRLRCFF